MKKNDLELTWLLSYTTVDYAALFSVQSVRLTVFETYRNLKLKETLTVGCIGKSGCRYDILSHGIWIFKFSTKSTASIFGSVHFLMTQCLRTVRFYLLPKLVYFTKVSAFLGVILIKGIKMPVKNHEVCFYFQNKCRIHNFSQSIWHKWC